MEHEKGWWVTRRTLMTVTAALIVAGFIAVTSVAARTPEELRTLVLTPEELGPSFTIRTDIPDSSPPPSFARVLVGESGPNLVVLGIDLYSDSDVPPSALFERAVRRLLGDPRLVDFPISAPITPAGYGEGAAATIMVASYSGVRAAGVIAAWRSGDVLADMIAAVNMVPGESVQDATNRAWPYVDRQRDKITGASRTIIFQAQGRGGGDTTAFSTSGGRIEVCLDFQNTPAGVRFRTSFHILRVTESTTPSASLINLSGNRCQIVTLMPGMHYIRPGELGDQAVVWRVVVRPA